MTNSKVRRSGRISKRVPILLIGHDPEGTVFTEEATTVVLSRHGAGIVSTHKLIAEQDLTLRSLESGRETEIRVVGEIGSHENTYTYGVAFLDSSIDFWGIPFPPSAAREPEPANLHLECTGCGANVALEHGDYEVDVCAINGGLIRYCVTCGLSTMWKRCSPDFPLFTTPAAKLNRRSAYSGEVTVAVADLESFAPPSKSLAKPPETPAIPASAANRRDRVRAKVNFFACIRTDAFGDDIVQCIDMSKGGLSFKTPNSYLPGSVVRIAVPFSPESRQAPAIFVPARIVYLKQLPSQSIHRCGVAYLPLADSYSQK